MKRTSILKPIIGLVLLAVTVLVNALAQVLLKTFTGPAVARP